MSGNYQSHVAAETKYSVLRHAALIKAQVDAQALLGTRVRVTEIDNHALTIFTRYWTTFLDRPEWDWPTFIRWQRRVTPQRFTAAFWFDQELCGLVYMKPSVRKTFLGIRLLEGAPWYHSLKGRIVGLAVTAAIPYAHGLGSGELRACDPLPDAVRKYERANFTVVRKGGRATYCSRRV